MSLNDVRERYFAFKGGDDSKEDICTANSDAMVDDGTPAKGEGLVLSQGHQDGTGVLEALAVRFNLESREDLQEKARKFIGWLETCKGKNAGMLV